MLTIDELSKKIDSPDEEMRREAIEGLLDVSFEPKILPLLKKAIGDESWRVRKSAVNVGVSFHEPAAVAAIVPLMIDLLRAEDNAGLRNSAVECLTRFGIKSAPYLIQNLNDKDHDVRKFIVDILSDIWTRKGDQVLDQGIVDALIIAIDDHNENVRLAAIEGLGKIGSNNAVQALLKILEKGDSALKFTTLEALGNIGRPIPMKGVYSALSDRFLKRAAYDLMGKVGGAEAVPYLMDGLHESSTSTREAAIAALYMLASSFRLSKHDISSHILHLTPSTIEKIASSLESPNLNVKKGVVFVLGLSGKKQAAEHIIKALYFNEIVGEAKQALIELGNKVLDVILNSYPRQEEQVRSLLCSILGEIGNKKAENVLVQAIKDNYGHVRSSAAKALGKINLEKAIPEIVSLLQDEFDDVRYAAVDALCYLAPDSDKILAAILPLLSKDDPYIREKAIIVLGKISRGIHRNKRSKGIEKVRLAIKDSSPIVRKAAVYALEGIGEEQYVQDVILALTDEDKQVRLAAAKVLGNMATKKAVDPLLLTLKDEDIWVKTAAVESLGKIGGENVIKVMKELVDDANGMIVCAALEAMAGIAGREPQTIKEIKPWAAKCLFHNDAEVVKVAAQVIARIDEEGVVTAITPLLEHQDWDVRAQVVDILSKRKDSFIRICLETHLKIETDDLVKQKITEALKDSEQ